MLTTFLFFDEEPLLDWSDLNFIHIGAMAVAALVVYYDLLTRARVGQYVMKDLNVAAAALTFIWGLENYVRLILLVFCLHNLLPLEIDLMELIEVYQAWGAWLTNELLVASMGVVLLLALTYILNLSLASGSTTLINSLIILLCLGHFVLIITLGWDLALAGLSSFSS